MIDYELLKMIWWALIVVLFLGFAVLGGRDLGVGMLLPLVTKTDDERRVLLNAIGPTWEGNQVWFVTAGGAVFAAWPMVYATAFSGLYFALLLVLFALILRPPGIDYRSKLPSPLWRKTWDWCLFIAGFVPILIFGVAIGNLFMGFPFHFDDSMRSFYTGSFFGLLNPFAILCGLITVLLMSLHAAAFISHKVEGTLNTCVRKLITYSGIVLVVLFSLATYLVIRMKGLEITSMGDAATQLKVMDKQVLLVEGGWLNNYQNYPALVALPILAFISPLLCVLCKRLSYNASALFMSSLATVAVILTPAVALFPFIFPSSSHLNHSLTIWDACSSQLTLQFLLGAVVIFLPIVLCYTVWAFRVMAGKITVKSIHEQVESY